MKRRLLVLFLLITACSMINAQQKNPDGVYLLQGVREMASGFNLKPDSTFEFFFTYGALDRYGNGTWQMLNNKIILNSKPHPGKDFKLTGSSKTADPFLLVQLDLKNPVFYNYVYAYSGELKEGEYPVRANSNGLIKLPAVADSVHLLFEFVPERISVFPVNTKTFNHLTFTFEPWITDVFFTDFILTFLDNKLEGTHPLLAKEHCEYRKKN